LRRKNAKLSDIALSAWMQEIGRKLLHAFLTFATSLWLSNAGTVAEGWETQNKIFAKIALPGISVSLMSRVG
jgi:hypothetical protein